MVRVGYRCSGGSIWQLPQLWLELRRMRFLSSHIAFPSPLALYVQDHPNVQLEARLAEFYQYFNPCPNDRSEGSKWEDDIKKLCASCGYDDARVNDKLRPQVHDARECVQLYLEISPLSTKA